MARWTTAAGGFGFIAFFVLAAVVYGNGAGRHPDEIVAYYAVPANSLAQREALPRCRWG